MLIVLIVDNKTLHYICMFFSRFLRWPVKSINIKCLTYWTSSVGYEYIFFYGNDGKSILYIKVCLFIVITRVLVKYDYMRSKFVPMAGKWRLPRERGQENKTECISLLLSLCACSTLLTKPLFKLSSNHFKDALQ